MTYNETYNLCFHNNDIFLYDTNGQIKYNFFISNSGKDTNPGTSKKLPKETIEGTLDLFKNFASINGKVSIGLKSQNVFNETLIPSYPVNISAYTDSANNNNFAVLSGSKVFDNGWEKLFNTTTTYKQSVTFSGYTGVGINGIGNYSYIYVIEIDKELEKTAPFTSRKILRLAPSLAAVDTLNGSFYEATTTSKDPLIIYIHTSNNSSPNLNNKYRYEISVKDYAVRSIRIKDNYFENLWVRDYGAGYGSIPSGENSYYNKIIFGPGAAIHQVVIANGTVNNSLFLNGIKNVNGSAATFYNVEGFSKHNIISNSIFLNVNNCIYGHTSGGSNYGAIELDNVFAFADNEGGNFLSAANTDTLLIKNTYIDKYTTGFGGNSARYVNIQNSYFRDITTGISLNTFNNAAINNIFISSRGNRGDIGIIMQVNTVLQLTNSIIKINSNNVSGTDRTGVFITGSGGIYNHITAAGNIFICDVGPDKLLSAATTNTTRGKATSSDIWNNNVYVLLRGKNILWTVSDKSTNGDNPTIESFKEWQNQSGQDKNSLFFDLRNDPRGLKAIFIDPDNGNYELANTVEGNKIRDLKAGMTNPIACFLKKPTYEEAAEMIRTGKIMRLNSCRYECQDANVNLEQSVNNSTSFSNICSDQDILFKGSGEYNKNDISYHQSDLTARYLWWFSDQTDTSGINLDKVLHKFATDGRVSTRLQMVDINGCTFDTTFTNIIHPIPFVKLPGDTTICTGSSLTLSVKYPAARYLWSTGSIDNSIAVKIKEFIGFKLHHLMVAVIVIV